MLTVTASMTVKKSSTELMIPETSLPVVAGDDNVLRLRVLHRGMKIASLEFAVRCQIELDGPGSKKQQDVADEIGCDQSVVSRAVAALKIIGYATDILGDLDAADAYDAAMREVRAPKDTVSLAALPPGVRDVVEREGFPQDTDDDDDDYEPSTSRQPREPEDVVDAELGDDNVYQPDPSDTANRAARGLTGALAGVADRLEGFSLPPTTPPDIKAALIKELKNLRIEALHAIKRLEGKS